MDKFTFHFLNVKNGDCSIIKHGSGHVSVVDTCNARKPENKKILTFSEYYQLEDSSRMLAEATGAKINYGQKKHPENPIEYLQKFGVNSVFRFILTHPDMDHMDGIKDFFEVFQPVNFYDTDNNKEIEGSWDNSPYRKEDWDFYRHLRESNSSTNPKRLTVFSGDDGIYRRRNWDGDPPGDAVFTLAPTLELVQQANEKQEDYNDASYVFMYYSPGGKIIMSGDSHDNTWEHVLDNHEDLVKDVDLLIAPHHGRKSGRSYEFLDVLQPKMTFFGNALSKDLAYDAWKSRNLKFITNNQAGSMVVNCRQNPLNIYVTNEKFARDRNPFTFYSDNYKGWYLQEID